MKKNVEILVEGKANCVFDSWNKKVAELGFKLEIFGGVFNCLMRNFITLVSFSS